MDKKNSQSQTSTKKSISCQKLRINSNSNAKLDSTTPKKQKLYLKYISTHKYKESQWLDDFQSVYHAIQFISVQLDEIEEIKDDEEFIQQEKDKTIFNLLGKSFYALYYVKAYTDSEIQAKYLIQKISPKKGKKWSLSIQRFSKDIIEQINSSNFSLKKDSDEKDNKLKLKIEKQLKEIVKNLNSPAQQIQSTDSQTMKEPQISSIQSPQFLQYSGQKDQQQMVQPQIYDDFVNNGFNFHSEKMHQNSQIQNNETNMEDEESRNLVKYSKKSKNLKLNSFFDKQYEEIEEIEQDPFSQIKENIFQNSEIVHQSNIEHFNQQNDQSYSGNFIWRKDDLNEELKDLQLKIKKQLEEIRKPIDDYQTVKGPQISSIQSPQIQMKSDEKLKNSYLASNVKQPKDHQAIQEPLSPDFLNSEQGLGNYNLNFEDPDLSPLRQYQSASQCTQQ